MIVNWIIEDLQYTVALIPKVYLLDAGVMTGLHSLAKFGKGEMDTQLQQRMACGNPHRFQMQILMGALRQEGKSLKPASVLEDEGGSYYLTVPDDIKLLFGQLWRSMHPLRDGELLIEVFHLAFLSHPVQILRRGLFSSGRYSQHHLTALCLRLQWARQTYECPWNFL